VGLLEETKGGGKRGKKKNNDEIHHYLFCVGTRHKETHWKLLKTGSGKRARKCSEREEGYVSLSTMHVQV
jgi:hypothetical protein